MRQLLPLQPVRVRAEAAVVGAVVDRAGAEVAGKPTKTLTRTLPLPKLPLPPQ